MKDGYRNDPLPQTPVLRFLFRSIVRKRHHPFLPSGKNPEKMMRIRSSSPLPSLVLAIGICMAWLMAAPHAPAHSAPAAKVGITPEIAQVEVRVGRQKYDIRRIQDTKHKLTGELALTSRPCPPHCIQPFLPVPGVHPVGELELIDFLKRHGEAMTGVMIDSRSPADYRKGTIPGAVNVPASLFNTDNPYKERILILLGGRKLPDGTWDFSRARELLLFCQGASCGKSPSNIRTLVEAGYPPEKLYYYRGGVQAWALMGFPLVRPRLPRKR